MKSVKPNKKVLKVFYILFTFIVIGWCIYFINNYWNSQASAMVAEQNGYVVSVNNGISNLPKPITIVPGQTSGLLSPTVSSYLAAQQNIDQAIKNMPQPFLFNVGFSYFKLNSVNNKVKNEYKSTNSTLDQTYNTLNINQKIIEYNPKVDLAPLLDGSESGSNERLSRTKEGISQTIEELKNSNIAYKDSLVAILEPIEAKALDVTPNNISEWVSEVLAAQKAILKVIEDDFSEKMIGHSSTLSQLGQDYLDI